MIYLCTLILSILPCVYIYPDLEKLQKCLEECWGVDFRTGNYLCHYFENNRSLIEDFINKSKQLEIEFPLDKELICHSQHDGVVQAAKFHQVVFETPYARILAGCASPGEREPFHTHAWKSLLVIFENASYEVEYASGHIELLNLQPGVYELPPEGLYACTNLGTKKERCLRFEVKAQRSAHEEPLFNMDTFEREIAYFFGVTDIKPVMNAYIAALRKLNEIGLASPELLEKAMLPSLEEAYNAVAEQRNWDFDTHLAAKIELQIILGNINSASFEVVQQLMVKLYNLVFQTDVPQIKKAAMLRTFLYQYKANAEKLTYQDQQIMLEIAKTSKELLNSIK